MEEKDKKKDDKVVLLCPPTFIQSAVKNSTVDLCSTCGEEVWVAPSGRVILAKHPTSCILCIPCGVMEMAEQKDVEIGSVNDEQRRDLMEYFGKEEKGNA